MNAILKELINKNKKNSRLSIADRELLENTLFDELTKGIYDEEVETVLCEGPAESVMKSLALYLISIESRDANEYIKRFIACDKIQENKGGSSGARMVILMAALVECSKEQNKMIEQVFSSMVYFAHKKDSGGINKKVLEQIRNSIFPLFESRDIILNLQFDREKAWVRTRDLFIEAILNTPNISINTVQKVYYWLQASGRPMGKYTEEYIINETVKQNDKKTEKPEIETKINDVNTKEKKLTEDITKEIEVKDEKETSKLVIEKKQATVTTESEKQVNPKENNEIIRKDSDELIMAMAKTIIAASKEITSMKAEMEYLKQKLDDTQITIDKSIIKQKQQEETIYEMSTSRQELQKQKLNLVDKIDELEKIVQKQQGEIDDRKQFTDTIARNREKQSEEQLNKLASKLKVDYRDYCDARDIDMTIDLGENMREQLGAVFSILEKGGIKLK